MLFTLSSNSQNVLGRISHGASQEDLLMTQSMPPKCTAIRARQNTLSLARKDYDHASHKLHYHGFIVDYGQRIASVDFVRQSILYNMLGFQGYKRRGAFIC